MANKKVKSKGRKLKSKRTCRKRFKITGTGKVKIKNAGKRHNMVNQKKRQLRVNRKPDTLKTKGLIKKIKRVFLNVSNKRRKVKK